MKPYLVLILLLAAVMPARAQELYILPRQARSAMSSLENLNGLKGRGGKANAGAKGNAFTELKNGQTQTLLETRGAGIIQRIWVTFDDRSPEMLRGLRLHMYWDGNATPAVDVPFGDFFCLNLGHGAAFENALFSTAEGRSYNCYIAMPFQKSARITLTNQSRKDLRLLFYDVDFIRQGKPIKDQLYFHAAWHRQPSSPMGQDVELLPKTRGKGRFIGVSVGVNVNPAYPNTWWGEGEVKLYIDGDSRYPSVNGTGAEDYIGTGWMEGVFVNRYQGCLLADVQKGAYSFYRFHIPDQVIFYHDFRATIQQIGGGDAAVVKSLQAKDVPLRPVSLYGRKGFRGLFEKNTPANELTKADDQDWLCFYRSDDYAVTAYYYLDKP